MGVNIMGVFNMMLRVQEENIILSVYFYNILLILFFGYFIM